jgi:hypothetical protein
LFNFARPQQAWKSDKIPSETPQNAEFEAGFAFSQAAGPHVFPECHGPLHSFYTVS